jgi:tricorn protease
MLKRALALIALLAAPALHAQQPHILRQPSLSRNQIAFLYADDVWTVSREGGEARRLTSSGDVQDGPYFSPDGTRIAYSTRAHGLRDVYVVPATGGIPRRLTWEPDGAYATGWTADGQSVLYASLRASTADVPQLWTVRADGVGPATRVALPVAVDGSYSPDGSRFAYVPVAQWEKAWKHYRGGQTTPIWIVDSKTLELEKIPRESSNDSSPAWSGTTVYFLSDRNGPVSLFSYNTASKAVASVVDNHSYDLKSVAAGPGGLVYEQFGSIHLYDFSSHAEHQVPIELNGELPALTPRLSKVAAAEMQNIALSPSGARVAVEAHGEIFTLPAEKGDTRDLTNTPGVAERDPSWSPDGKTVAYFSDASGEYQLFLRDPSGLTPPRIIDLGPNPSYYYAPRWSPDSKRIVFYDKHLTLWYVDLQATAPKPVKITQAIRSSFGGSYDVSWSPDSQWLSYTRDLENQVHAVFLYSCATHASTQVTDGMSDAGHPVFDPNGKYLYFLASTDNGPSSAGIDLSTLDRAVSNSAYVLVLAADGASPIPPQSDDEKKDEDDKKAADAKKDDTKGDTKGDTKKSDAEKKPEPTKVDLDGMGNRILSLPIPTRNYVDLQVAKTGVLFLAEASPIGRSSREDGGPPITGLWRFTLDKRETEQILANLAGFNISANGEKILLIRGESWFLANVSELHPGSSDAPQGKPVNNGAMMAMIDPHAEWAQQFRETWRIERDFFYDPHLHGLDLAKVEARYQPWVAGLASRAEFSALSTEMLGEIEVGHMFISGPHGADDAPKPGLLGADYTLSNNRYRFLKIYNGQNWRPQLRAPLTVPGIHVEAGEYLLAVNGRELHATDNVDSFLDGMAGKQVVLRVGTKPDGSDARDVTVVPTDSEHPLRILDWIESNRRKVDELSGGKVAYVYMPNTGGQGYSNFNRYFYAQLDKQGLVLDERYNEGGLIADYIVDVLSRKPLSGAIERDGKPVHDPIGAIYGPKAMIINESAGSGGDAMPWYFRKANLGTLVGVRTWGGLVGIGGYPTLIDGGGVTAPRYAIYGLKGEWEVEGHGIPPDVEVEMLPKDIAAGHDLQLERAVAVVLQQLKEHPVTEPPVPPYPNFHQHDGLGR